MDVKVWNRTVKYWYNNRWMIQYGCPADIGKYLKKSCNQSYES